MFVLLKERRLYAGSMPFLPLGVEVEKIFAICTDSRERAIAVVTAYLHGMRLHSDGKTWGDRTEEFYELWEAEEIPLAKTSVAAGGK